MKMTINKEIIKSQVKILRESLTEKISQSAAYNIISKMYGFDSWNHLNAELTTKEPSE